MIGCSIYYESSLELEEVFVDQLDGLVDIPRHSFILHVAPHHPSVDHLSKLQTASLLFSKSLGQDLDDLSVRLDIGRIILCRPKVCWTTDLVC
jgi:hypothetical protein